MGVSIADMRQPDEPLIYVNNAFTMITGYPRELAVGYNCRFLQGPETDRTEVDRIREAISSGRPYSGELINYRLDGSRFWNRLTLYPVGGTGQKPDFYVSNQVDISHVKQQISLPQDQILRLSQSVDDAQQALAEAVRFREAIKSRLEACSGALCVEEEALLQAELQAHDRLVEALESIKAWSEERGSSL
jgi:PAS domain S-box-containing protein